MWYLGPADGITSLILAHIHAFLQWYVPRFTDAPDELDPQIFALARQVAVRGTAALQADTTIQAAHIDALVEEFCFNFSSDDILDDAGPSLLNVTYYQQCAGWLGAHGSPFTQQMWEYLLGGRGIGRDSRLIPFHPLTPDRYEHGLVAYWTAQECQRLLPELRSLPPPPTQDVQNCLHWSIVALEQAVQQHRSVIILTV
jgi:hypothetical protein